MTTTTEHSTKCQGCGREFATIRGLRSHQAGRFVSMACRPIAEPCDRRKEC